MKARAGRCSSTARDVLAAEFRHTTARGVAGGERARPAASQSCRRDGGGASGWAVRGGREPPVVPGGAGAGRVLPRRARPRSCRSRGMRSRRARAAGAVLRGRGISEGVREALSGRSREVWLAAERFRARYGRAPERDELRNVKLENRQAKMPQSRPELQATWEQRAAGRARRPRACGGLCRPRGRAACNAADEAGWRERVTDSLTAEGATFS